MNTQYPTSRLPARPKTYTAPAHATASLSRSYAGRPRRPLAYIAAAYIAGIAFCYFFSPPIAFFAIIIPVAALLLCLFRLRHLFVFLLCFTFLSGSLYAHISFTKADPLERHIAAGKPRAENITGTILAAEQREADYLILTVLADGRKLLVRQFGEQNIYTSSARSGSSNRELPETLIGKNVRISGRISCPDTARNPRTFDYRLYLLSQNIRVVLTCERAGDIRITGNAAGPYWRFLSAMAQAKSAFIKETASVLSPEKSALWNGMMFGDTEAMDEETYELFKRNGVAHILSVSGLHIAMVYAFVSFALGRRKTKTFYITALALLLCYAALSGFSPSVTRAFTMIAVHIFAMLTNRRYDMLTGVLFSALIMLIQNPLALFGVGFILSYTAVCSLAFTLPLLDRHTGFRDTHSGFRITGKELSERYRTTLAARAGAAVLKTLVPAALIQVFVLPTTVYFFNNLPAFAIFINIPVIAIASLIVPFGVVVMLLTTAAALLQPFAPMLESLTGVGASSAGVLMDLMLALTEAADRIPYSSFPVASPPFCVIVTFYGVAYFLLSDTFAMSRFALIRKSKESLAAAFPAASLAAVILLCALTAVAKQNDALFTFVDVGQGDCLHIHTQDGRNYLMDGGGDRNYNIGKDTLAPYLLKNGVSKLDGVFISHLHMDHYKGITELAEVIDIGAIYTYEGNRAAPEVFTPPFPPEDIRFLAAGDIISLGSGTRAETLYPPRLTDEAYMAQASTETDENLTSLIIRFNAGDVSVLMTGDISKDGESAALSASDLSCDILKIPHHGSRTSSSDALLAAASPAAAVIQAGKNNTYGHPARETLAKLSAYGIPVYRNDQSGAIIIHPAKNGLSVRTAKRDYTSPMLIKSFERDKMIQ